VGGFIQEFREQQGAPVILCSGYLEEDLALEGIACGQCSFLPKPFSAADLNALVDELLEGRVNG
jgi:DNA-binding NtrC family response regulator